ncbi:MAG: hypothetical protein WC295_12230 [Methanoregula sp.]|jgi:hypothetical protein
MTACTENVSPGKASSLYPAGTAHDHIPTSGGLISGITPQATGLPLAPDVTPISREVNAPGTTMPGAGIPDPASREAIISIPVRTIEQVLPVPFAGNRDIATPGTLEPAIIQCTRSVRLALVAPGTATGGLPGVRVIPAGLAATLESPQSTDLIAEVPHPADTLAAPGAGSQSRITYYRGKGQVYEAMAILAEWHYQPARISNTAIPVDIIAFKKSRTVLAQVISSKKPMPDAATLTRYYPGRLDSIRRMGTSDQHRKIVMAYSLTCGWKYYDVLPGGLIPAWSLSEDEH